jgi:TPR repeat protein
MDPGKREWALRLQAQGTEQLQRGNVYAARKFFELAAEAGLASGAVAAAATYDPNELGKLNVVGLQPDAEAARKWYEKARELGAVEATERLRRLGSR